REATNSHKSPREEEAWQLLVEVPPTPFSRAGHAGGLYQLLCDEPRAPAKLRYWCSHRAPDMPSKQPKTFQTKHHTRPREGQKRHGTLAIRLDRSERPLIQREDS